MQDKFSYESKGYNRREVNDFINDVIKESSAIVEKYKKQQAEIDNLKKKIEHYEGMEDGLRDAILKTSNEANEIIMDAKMKASKIVNDALIRADKTDNKRKLLESNINIYKKRLKLIIKEQQSILEEIEDLELFDE